MSDVAAWSSNTIAALYGGEESGAQAAPANLHSFPILDLNRCPYCAHSPHILTNTLEMVRSQINLKKKKVLKH